MQTKLTLRLEEDLIERAKNYAKQSGKSVSQLVADYFIQIQLTPSPHNQSHKTTLTPITTRLCGALSSVSIKDDKQAYREHLDQKHL
jgi:hypothetical protein